jgi:DNA-binding transcriptional LysR family regulator
VGKLALRRAILIRNPWHGITPVIELRQLRSLIAAAEAGSFSRAARNLNIKRATLTRHILEVDKRLGMALFDRRTRG